MSFVLIPTELVEALHDHVLNPRELQGRAREKSLDGALGRVDNRLVYGMIGDVFDLAAAYAAAIATGHCFNDANKRTAYRCMIVALALNGIRIEHVTNDVGDRIILLAQGKIDESDLAGWIRGAAL